MNWRGTVVEAGVDWLTCTAKADTFKSRMLRELAEAAVGRERSEGHDLREYRTEGYRMVGAGGAAWGLRPEDTILRLSGAAAHEWWVEAVQHADNVSRCDLEVTARLPSPVVDLHREHERQHATRTIRGRGKPPVVGIIEGARYTATGERRTTGGTLTIGSRSSDVYIRAYDKGAERAGRSAPPPAEGGSWGPGLWWRYEVEYKRRRARDAVRALLDTPADQRGAAVRTAVHGALTRTGVRPRFVVRGGPDLLELTAPPRGRSDTGRRLAYLRTVVVPMLERLFDDGQAEAVMAAMHPLAGRARPVSARVQEAAGRIRDRMQVNDP